MEMGGDGNIPFWIFPSSALICCGMCGCLLVGAQGATLQHHMLPAFLGSSIWTLESLAISPQTLEILAVIAVVTRVDMKI